MTDPEALAEQDLLIPGWPEDTPDGAPWDSFPMDDWGTHAVGQTPSPAAPWFRNPRLLFGLIAVAAAALVVATVLLITGRESGEIPTAPQLSTRTAPTTPPSEASTPRAPSESPTTSSSSPSAPSPSAESSPAASQELPAPAEPAQPAGPPPAQAPSPAAGRTGSAGPKINVTRTPMSFTPGKH